MTFTPARRLQAESESLDQYLREISAYSLIDREEECRLAKRIRDGDGDAMEHLVRANLRFVVAVAKKYQNQGVSLADLINEGNIGLMRAARKFDETKGIKFISYAVWWIRQAILQALAEQSRIVRVPLSRAGAVHRIGRRSSALTQELGREPTLAELASEMEVPENEVSHALAMSQVYLSLDAPLVPGEDGALSRPRRRSLRSRPQTLHRRRARHAQRARVAGAPPLLRPRRHRADDAGADRRKFRHHPRAGAPDQGEGASPAAAPVACALPRDVPRVDFTAGATQRRGGERKRRRGRRRQLLTHAEDAEDAEGRYGEQWTMPYLRTLVL
jgi:RNA polymerase sigma factor (sigma-70 family)